MKKIKTEKKRLNLMRETLRQLNQSQLEQVDGGVEISTSRKDICGTLAL